LSRANSPASSAKFRFSTNTLTSSSDLLPTRTRRLRGLSHASRLLSPHVVSPPPERSTHSPRNLSRARTEAPSTRRAGKEPIPEYNSDSDAAPGHASDSNPLSGFYSDSAYEFDFGSDPEDPKSEDNTT
jgi:hypothetical protein